MANTYRVQDLIVPEAVLIKRRILIDIKELFHIIGEFSADVYNRTNDQTHRLSSAELSKSLHDRANLYPIGTGGGILLPHGHVYQLDRFIGVFVKWTTRQQLEKTPDGAPIDLIFAMFGPRDEQRSDLRLLVYMAQIFSNHDFRGELRDAENPQQIYQILTRSTLSSSTVPKP